MNRRVLIKPSISVPAVYLDLEDSEAVCTKCKGIGVVTTVFGLGWRQQETVTCSVCNSNGKVVHNMRGREE